MAIRQTEKIGGGYSLVAEARSVPAPLSLGSAPRAKMLAHLGTLDFGNPPLDTLMAVRIHQGSSMPPAATAAIVVGLSLFCLDANASPTSAHSKLPINFGNLAIFGVILVFYIVSVFCILPPQRQAHRLADRLSRSPLSPEMFKEWLSDLEKSLVHRARSQKLRKALDKVEMVTCLPLLQQALTLGIYPNTAIEISEGMKARLEGRYQSMVKKYPRPAFIYLLAAIQMSEGGSQTYKDILMNKLAEQWKDFEDRDSLSQYRQETQQALEQLKRLVEAARPESVSQRHQVLVRDFIRHMGPETQQNSGVTV